MSPDCQTVGVKRGNDRIAIAKPIPILTTDDERTLYSFKRSFIDIRLLRLRAYSKSQVADLSRLTTAKFAY